VNNILKPRPVSTRQFDWDSADRKFVGEISSTHGFGRVYADACDEGLTMVSARTGREVVVVIDTEVRDANGDVQFWVLVPADSGAPKFTVQLFND
jgi:hypothetical protein